MSERRTRADTSDAQQTKVHRKTHNDAEDRYNREKETTSPHGQCQDHTTNKFVFDDLTDSVHQSAHHVHHNGETKEFRLHLAMKILSVFHQSPRIIEPSAADFHIYGSSSLLLTILILSDANRYGSQLQIVQSWKCHHPHSSPP